MACAPIRTWSAPISTSWGSPTGRNLWDGTLPDYSPAERTGIYNAMCDTLAALHNTDHVAAGLGEYGKPGNYFERQVARLDQAV